MTDQPNQMPVSTCPRTDRHGYHMWADADRTAICPGHPAPADTATAPLPSPHADVQGRCPACGCTRLLLGEGGYVTCPRIDCPEPDAASTLLEGRTAQPDETARCPKSEPHARHMWTWREEGVDCPGLPSADATTRHVGTSAVASHVTADNGLPTDHLRMSTGTRVPTVDRLIAALADVAAERRLTTAEVERLRAAALACGYAEADAAPATADDGLRERVAAALVKVRRNGMGAYTEAEACQCYADAVMAVRDDHLAGLRRTVDLQAADLKRLAGERNGVQADLARWLRRLAKTADQLKRAEAAVNRVRALAADMRTWCSHHDIAVDYAQRIDDALAGREADRA